MLQIWCAQGERADLEDHGHVKVAQVEADALQVDDVDLAHCDDGEGHVDQLHQAVDGGHHEASLPLWHTVESKLPEGDFKLQAQVPAACRFSMS